MNKAVRRSERKDIGTLLLEDVAWEDIPGLLDREKAEEQRRLDELDRIFEHLKEMDRYWQ